ncbi:MAG TPA: hypothetical protein VFG31_09255 [Conexibacter sp.]|nr:hypothetical protein [Conexibacter sp.]
MLGMQIVTAPNGERWQVGRRWLSKPPPKPWSRRKRRETDDDADWTGWLDAASFIDVGDDFLAGVVVALVVAAVIALFVFAIVPLLGLAFELALLIGVFLSGLFSRLVLRHPWTIEAVNLTGSQRRLRFAVRGWRRSRRAISALAETIAATGPPSALPEATLVAADS